MNNFDIFSEREKEVIDLLVQGKSNKQIALQLKVSNRTVEFHLSNIYSKLEVSSRTEAVLLLMKDAPLSPEEAPVETTWREPTVLPNDESSYNGGKAKKRQRIPMKKRTYYLIGSGLLIVLFLLLVFVIDPQQNLKTFFAGIAGKNPDGIPVEVATPQEDGSIIHTVKEGQTLWSIAAAYDITVDQLRLLNYLPEDSDVIYEGQKFYIRTPSTQEPTLPSIVAPTPFYRVQTSEAENTFTQSMGSSTVNLVVKWFYIDQNRVYLDLVVSDFPLPQDFSPIRIIDTQKINIYRADGSAVNLDLDKTNFGGGGGGGGEENATTEEDHFFNETLDVPLSDTLQENSQEETYLLDIPVGGEITGEDGEIRTLPLITYHIELKPFYKGQLTFTTEKSAVIDNKTVTFKGMEINPTSAAVLFCVFDPQGSQWFPTVHILYKGNIISGSGGALMNGDPSQEMCYRLRYTRSFQFDTADDPQTDISIMVAKLTKDQPERLPYELIAHVQNALSEQGIEFNYVIISHGSGIEVTKKPAGMTEAEALSIIQKALTEEATSSDVLIFDLN